MPEGTVLWWDEAMGEGRVIHSGRRYTIRSSDTEATARVAGVRVHFDVDADATTGIDVRSCSGGRTNGAHGGVNNLAGSHSAWMKAPSVPPTATLEMRRLDRRHPIRLARAWSDTIARGGLDDALLMYAPDAQVARDRSWFRGRDQLAHLLEALPVFDAERPASTIRGNGGQVTVTWNGEGDREPFTTTLVIEHGEIVEQSLDGTDEEPLDVTGPAAYPIQVAVNGHVAKRAAQYARDKVLRVAEHAHGPILFVQIVLTQHADPAVHDSAVAEAVLDVNGELVRARVAGAKMMQAIDKLDERLRDRLEHNRALRGWSRPHDAAAGADQGRPGHAPVERPPVFDRPVDEREVVRHKTWAPGEMTVDEAVCDLETLDHDFYLFRELLTSRDSVLYRALDGTYGLMQVEPDHRALQGAVSRIELHSDPAPHLTVAEAVERLGASEERFVFFLPTESESGALLYRRYDGHYGLIVADR